ncbi:MAG: pilus assembly protein PilM [Oscillospiraceae bacterium]|nr:pilus assembly protein PilM [Oscillospiraceae bacterium]
MAKTILGIDVGYDSMKLAMVKKGVLKKYAIIPMPENMVREGHVVSPESMGELIRKTMKEKGIHCNDAAIVLPNETVFIRNVIMPQMSAEQLQVNLPYEFRDYINSEMRTYYYDYAMIRTEIEPPASEGENSEPQNAGRSMELMAAAVPVSMIEEIRSYLRKAGLKLKRAAPTVSSWQGLIRWCGNPENEYCILDLGHQAIRMYMFNGDKHIVTRELEVGISRLIQLIADTASVDEHLAEIYLTENHEGWQTREECRSAYENIAVELMRALNFYRFSTPETKLNDIYLCGGGASIQPLCDVIAETIGMNIHRIDELVPGGERIENCAILAQAIGITLEEGR